ncbi:MAG: methylamine utilization protein [Idiomarina sp.]|nr:methylamine utilization protein [Idiomarina sp.]
MAFPVSAEVLRFVDNTGAHLEGVVVFQTSAEVETSLERDAHIMDQVQRQFLPNLLLIAAGDSVSFPNSDSIRHHVYSFSTARSFDIELYGNSETPTLDFPDAGLVVVGCNIHDDMIGYIVVSANGEFLQSNIDGELELPSDFAKDGWYVWHPWMATAGYAPVALADISSAHPHRFEVQAPAARAQSDLESRFRRRLQRGN